MAKFKITVQSTGTTGTSDSKDFNGVNSNYVVNIGFEPSTAHKEVDGIDLPDNYETFWAWADAVARGINSLTTGSYVRCNVTAVFDTGEEMA